MLWFILSWPDNNTKHETKLLILQYNPIKINNGWTTHTPIVSNKTHKIIVGRIIWSISNNDNPYKLNWQIDTIYRNIHAIYLNISDIVKIDYCILWFSKPINICGKQQQVMWNATNNSIKTNLNKVPIQQEWNSNLKHQPNCWDLTFTTTSATSDKLKEEKIETKYNAIY